MCRCTITFALVVMLCAAALGALGASPAAAFTLAGTVVDAGTGAPLAGVHYELALYMVEDTGVWDLVQSSGTTGTDGGFMVSGSGMGWGSDSPWFFELTFTDPGAGYCDRVLERDSRLDDWPTGQWVDPADETGMVVALTKAVIPSDTTAPQTSISLMGWPFWSRTPVTATLTAIDDAGGSGVAHTEYRLDDGPWTEGTEVAVPAPADHGNDGLHIIAFYSVDNAGNVEPPNEWQVIIDTRRPRVLSAGPCTMVAGAGTIRLTASDDRSDSVTGVLTFRHVGSPRFATTITLPFVPADGVAHDASFAYALPRKLHKWRVFVRVVDPAGNCSAAHKPLLVQTKWGREKLL